ncbi:MAG TPA: hypothetical protein VI636_00080 [Candidatus Angelobacter sp.]
MDFTVLLGRIPVTRRMEMRGLSRSQSKLLVAVICRYEEDGRGQKYLCNFSGAGVTYIVGYAQNLDSSLNAPNTGKKRWRGLRRKDCLMTSLFKGFCLCVVIIFAEIAGGQQCQQQCSDDYNACTAAADEQFAQQMALVLECAASAGSGSACPPLYAQRCKLDTQCIEDDYNLQLWSCQAVYDSCVFDCGALEISRNTLRPKGAVCLAKAADDDAGWDRMVQRLSGGGERKNNMALTYWE